MRTGTALAAAAILPLLLFSNTTLLVAEETGTPTQSAPVITPEASVTPIEAAPQTQWLYGEVVSIDTAGKTATVKYLDYETDQEKETAILTDENSAFENIASLAEVKPGDSLSIDYIVSADGKNLAKNINLEKPQAEESVAAESEAVPTQTEKANP